MHIMDLVKKHNLQNAFHSSYGLRGIFDPYCAEWDWLAMDDKIKYLKEFLQYVSISELIELYAKSGLKQHIIQEIPSAIKKLSLHSVESKEYLVNGSRCFDIPYFRLSQRAEEFAEELLEKAGL